MVTITEQQGIKLTVTFKDSNGSAITPNTITYNVKDTASDSYVIEPTNVNPDKTVDISIISDDNIILDRKNNKERRVFTILWTYNNGLGGSKEYKYTIKKLVGIEP